MDQEAKKPSKADRTRAAILAAAQKLFAGQGYELTTVRDIAAMAEIDPALVIRYFGSKEELFARAAVFNLKLPDLSMADRSKVGEIAGAAFPEPVGRRECERRVDGPPPLGCLQQIRG